ncbi:MAG: U32 family peptidase C-terminal domain-containing protein [Mariprofundales bacterium]
MPIRPKIELLAPAGTPEKLDFALHYGADAVYLSDKRFGLRAKAGNFTVDQIDTAVKKVRALGKRVYVTLNIFAHQYDLDALPHYLKQLNDMGVDALIITDAGVLRLAREYAPDIKLTLSTQANTLNGQAVRFWYEQGVRRVVLARESTIADITAIHKQIPEMELECFVHGSVCIAYSGRCFISNYMTGRDANKGDCTNSCRWNYATHAAETSTVSTDIALQEPKRQGEYFPIEEDSRGTYFFNSKDLNLLASLPRLANAGVSSLKIEGRGKSVHYLATTVATYRRALDIYLTNPDDYKVEPDWQDELRKIPHRNYTQGFVDGAPSAEEGYLPDNQRHHTGSRLVALVRSIGHEYGSLMDMKHPLNVGQDIECLSAKSVRVFKVNKLIDIHGHPTDVLKPSTKGYMPTEYDLQPYDILRLVAQ